jgi:3D (Asp-Asp-Asp) domain-containing protein
MAAPHRALARALLLLGVMLLTSACASLGPPGQGLVVTATAYNGVPEQTDGDPEIGAWGDRLHPGMRVIAVSPDLLALGLVRNSRVRIEGLGGEYRVLDKMPRRWQRRIDIFMGKDRGAARQWGKRLVRIEWAPPEERSRWGFLCSLFRTCG